MQNDIVLKMEHMYKSFPGVNALIDMKIELKRGEILGLVGENGAGKSTLIKVLSGALAPDRGIMTLDGETFGSMTPARSIAKGISVIYQELNLVPQLTVYENIFLGKEIVKNGFINKSEMQQKTKKLLNSLGIDINPNTQVRKLSVAFQQLVEVAKAVAQNAKILVLDEPTSSLSNSEVKALFNIINMLKQRGVSMIYISHRLEEVFDLCDNITVMRDGQYINTVNAGSVSREELIRMMVGRKISETYPERKSPVSDKIILKVKNLKGPNVNNVSFSLYKGEILGFAGLVGAGRTETARVLFGAEKKTSGEIYYDGNKLMINKPIDAINAGIGFIPEDRKNQGLNLIASINDNIAIANLTEIKGRVLLSKKKERSMVNRYVKYLSIKTPNTKKKVSQLSGGNQQKVVLAKWLAKNCSILILDEPTRGIDVGSKHEIYKLMRELTEKGISIIMISSDMPELLGMSDRILVMHDHRINGELQKNEFSQQKILDIASGGVAK